MDKGIDSGSNQFPFPDVAVDIIGEGRDAYPHTQAETDCETQDNKQGRFTRRHGIVVFPHDKKRHAIQEKGGKETNLTGNYISSQITKGDEKEITQQLSGSQGKQTHHPIPFNAFHRHILTSNDCRLWMSLSN
jgi:hypothetical protein